MQFEVTMNPTGHPREFKPTISHCYSLLFLEAAQFPLELPLQIPTRGLPLTPSNPGFCHDRIVHLEAQRLG